MKRFDYKLDKLVALVKNMMHQIKNSSPDKVELHNYQGSDTSDLVSTPFTDFTPSDQDH